MHGLICKVFLTIIIFNAFNIRGEVLSLKNQHLELKVDKISARWTLHTVQGLVDFPSDDNHILTGPDINSFCIVRIDNVDKKFGSIEGKLTLVSSSANSVIHSWIINGIEILQELSLTDSVFTTKPTFLKIKYWIKNKTKYKKKIGLKVLIDTFLSPNDDAPFIIPLIKDYISTELNLKKSIPDFWAVWDEISSPYSFAVMSFIDKDVVKPDSLAFASRKRLSENIWDFIPEPNKNYRPTPFEPQDGACSLTWEPILFRPDKENGIAFKFGLAEPSVSFIFPLELILLSPLTISNESLWVIGEIKNSDSVKSIKNISIKLILPSETEIINGASLEEKIQELSPNTRRFFSWQIKSNKKGAKEFQCVVTGNYASTVAVNRVTRTIKFK